MVVRSVFAGSTPVTRRAIATSTVGDVPNANPPAFDRSPFRSALPETSEWSILVPVVLPRAEGTLGAA